ncbi:uncharacterized protein [Medicago truncatula]|uniref:uncharacterized protein n=1 Tax=Medicago truncatula TaxID=3880 RepID=UPI0019679CF4|nr:uncharacterized protein LOC112418585 [Medicago truncatula]
MWVITSSLTSTLQGQTLFMPRPTGEALPLGPPLSKSNISFAMDTNGVLVQDPPLFGFTTRAPTTLLTTLASSITRGLKMLSFGTTTKTATTPQKVVTLGYFDTRIPPPLSSNLSWTWIWKLRIPEKFKLLIWLVCHNAVPALSLIHHHHIAPSTTCSRCGEDDETILHCLRDCSFSKNIWFNLEFTAQVFFTDGNASSWVRNNASGMLYSTFFVGLWWTWRHRNLMCLNHETWSLHWLNYHIQNTAETIVTSLHSVSVPQSEIMVHWNNLDSNCIVLNVDGSCLGEPIRAGFGGVIPNSAGFYISEFSGFIASTTGILFAELTAIHRGLLLAVKLGIEDMLCYSDSMLSIKLLIEHASNYHAYAVLIQDIKDILSTTNFSIHHCFREGNQCADLMAKLGATSNADFSSHATPPSDLFPESLGFFFSVCCLLFFLFSFVTKIK